LFTIEDSEEVDENEEIEENEENQEAEISEEAASEEDAGSESDRDAETNDVRHDFIVAVIRWSFSPFYFILICKKKTLKRMRKYLIMKKNWLVFNSTLSVKLAEARLAI
jgi:hypothetical protein